MTTKWFSKLPRGKFDSRETGAGTFIFNFLLFPVVLACFGLAFDFTASYWAKGALQQYLDAATQSALGQINNPTNGTSPIIGDSTTTARARANLIAVKAEDQYAQNRFGLPFLACQTGGAGNPSVPGGYVAVRPADGCTYSMNSRPNLNTDRDTGVYTFTMNVHEATHYVFLRALAVNYQTYNLRSTATLTPSYVQR